MSQCKTRAILRFRVLKILFAIALCALVTGCQETRNPNAQSIVLLGATCIPSPGAAPLPDAIVVVAGGTIRAVGLRKDVPVPQDSARTNLDGQFILPGGPEPIAPGQPANLAIHSSADPASPVVRRMTAGHWTP